MYWELLTFKELEHINKNKVVLLPVGAIEAHGMHLPLGTDSIISYWLCRKISQKYPCIVGPLINFGLSESLLSFPGTISIRKKTLKYLLEDTLSSILNHGFKKIFILNGHGGNDIMIEEVVNKFNRTKREVKIKWENWYNLPFLKALKIQDKSYRGDHADKLETEILLALYPKLVKRNVIKDHLPKWPVKEIKDYRKIMKYGVYGFPSTAKKERGEKLFKKIISKLVRDIKNFDGKG